MSMRPIPLPLHLSNTTNLLVTGECPIKQAPSDVNLISELRAKVLRSKTRNARVKTSRRKLPEVSLAANHRPWISVQSKLRQTDHTAKTGWLTLASRLKTTVSCVSWESFQGFAELDFEKVAQLSYTRRVTRCIGEGSINMHLEILVPVDHRCAIVSELKKKTLNQNLTGHLSCQCRRDVAGTMAFPKRIVDNGRGCRRLSSFQ